MSRRGLGAKTLLSFRQINQSSLNFNALCVCKQQWEGALRGDTKNGCVADYGLEPKQDMFKTPFPVIVVGFICGVSWCRIRLSKIPFCVRVIHQGKRRIK